MPRGRLARRTRRKEMQALRYEQLCRTAKVARRDQRVKPVWRYAKLRPIGWIWISN